MNRNRHPFLTKLPQMLHGGDYNPEQWGPDTWADDDVKMQAANWNEVTMGVFSWVSLEPEEGKFVFDWLDDRMEAQARAGRIVCLATPSAAPPAWLSKAYPETLRATPGTERLQHGNRVNYCWSSKTYLEKARIMAEQLATRYGSHPALGAWHVSNELGGACTCLTCQDEFRTWLKARHRSLDSLNAAYWTAFWSHTYTDWEQIEIPGERRESSIMGLTLDWKRFVSDRMVNFFRNEAEVLRKLTPEIPVTTNLMGTYPELDPWTLAPHMDFVAWDSYPFFAGKPTEQGSWLHASFCHDLNRSLLQKPFLLMECSPSSSNWYQVMALKRPNQHMLEGMLSIAHGSDGVQYFQWRQGRGSGEQFHGAVVAHNNSTEARVFQDVAALGSRLGGLTDVCGTTTPAKVALIFDWENSWAIDTVVAPKLGNRGYLRTLMEHYRALWEAGIACDIITSTSDFSRYDLVIAPMLHMLKPGVPEALYAFVESGGSVLSGYWSGVVDENVLAFQNGGQEVWKKLFGIWVEEIDPLYEGQTNRVESLGGGLLPAGASYEASEFCELLKADRADVLATYAEDFYAGRPAVTRNRVGSGEAVYVCSRNEFAFTKALVLALCANLGIDSVAQGDWPEGVHVALRAGQESDFLFVLNTRNAPAVAIIEGVRLELPPFGVEILLRDLESRAVQIHKMAPQTNNSVL